MNDAEDDSAAVSPLDDATASLRSRAAILDQLSDAVVVVDRGMRVTYMNRAACERYEHRLDAALNRQLDEVYSIRWERREDEEAAHRTLIEKGRWQGETWHVARSGREYRVDSTVTLIEDGGMVATIRDITGRYRARTERAQARQAIGQSRALVASFYESAPLMMGIAELDGDHTVAVSGNREMARFLDVAPEDVAGKSGVELGNRADLERTWVERYRECQRTRAPVRFECEYPRPDGARWLSATVAFVGIASSGRPRFSFVAEDITDRKRVEDQLAERHRQLDLLSRTSERLLSDGGPEEELLDTVFRDIAALLGVESYYHFRPIEPRLLGLHLAGGVGEAERQLFGTMRFGELLCGRVAESKYRLVVEDLQHTSQPGADLLRAAGATSYAGFPMVANGSLIGTLAFVSARLTHFRRGELQTIQSICDQVAITIERRRLQRDLEASEARYRGLVDLMPAAMYTCDGEGRITFYNRQAAAIWGRVPGSDETDQRFCGSFRLWRTDGTLLPHAETPVAVCLSNGESFRGNEVEVEREDGSRVTVSVSVDPIRDREGNIAGAVNVFVDITARKRAEEALRLTNRRLEAALEASGLVLFNQDRDLRYTWVHNPALGFAAQEVIGQRDVDLLELSEDAAQLDAVKRAVLASGTPGRQEVRIVRGGEHHYFDLVVHPERSASGAIVGVDCAALDVTEQKLAAEQLRASEERHAYLLRLADELQPLADPYEIQAAAARILGEHLQASRVHYAEVTADGSYAIVRADFAPGVPSVAGPHRLDDYSPLVFDEVRAGRSVMVSDVQTDARLTADEKRRTLELGALNAYVVVPLHKQRRTGALLVVHKSRPHEWTDREVALIQETAERTWDAVERARAEDALRTAGESFRQLVEQSPFGVYAVDADFRLAMVSAGAQKVFENVRPLLGRDFDEVLHIVWPEPFAGEALAHFRRTLTTGQSYHAPSTVERRADIGETEAYDWKLDRVVMPDGRPGVVCHFYDLSERQRYEEALHESGEMLRTVLAGTPDLVWAKDRNGRITMGNDATFRVLGGGAPDLVIGGDAQELVPDAAEAQAIEENDARVLELGVTALVEEAFTRGGETRLFQTVKAPLRNARGEITGIVGVSRDITEQKLAEERLRASEERQAFLLSLSDSLRVIVGAGDTIETGCRLLGERLGVDRAYYVEIDEAEGMARVEREYLGGASPSLVGQHRIDDFGWVIPTMRRGETLVMVDARSSELVPPGDRPMMTAVRIAAHVNAPLVKWGRLVGALCVTEPEPRDWTAGEVELIEECAERIWAAVERARAEQALRDSEELLRRALAAKDEFLGLVSHELRTPLTPILGMGNLLARGLDRDEDRVEATSTLLEAAQRLHALVENMLIIARLDHGDDGDIEMEPVLPARVAHRVVERHRQQYPQRAIVVDDRAAQCVVMGNAGWLEQVLQNFLGNAEKYSGDGASITVALESTDAEFVARVIDSGRGISPEQASHVFEPFFRDPETIAKVPGAGLGLAVCKRLVELQGGRIWAQPATHGGAEFGFTLKRATGD